MRMLNKLLFKLKTIIGKKDLVKLRNLSMLLFFLGIFEFLTVLSIYPFINYIIGNYELGFGLTIDNLFFLKDDSVNFKLLIVSIVISFYVIKTILFIYYNYKINIFLAQMISNLSQDIYSKSLNDSYTNHKQKVKSNELHVIQNETYNFFNFLRVITQLISESILFTLIILVLLVIEPLGILAIMLTFILIYLSFYKMIVKRSRIWGEERQKSDLIISKNVIESLTLFKEIKIYGLEKQFIKNLIPSLERKSHVTAKQLTFEQLPRFFLEVVLLICTIIYLFTLYYLNIPSGMIISKSLVFVAASYKLIPSVNRIFSSLQGLKFYFPSLEIMYQRLSSPKILNEKKAQNKPFNFNKSIVFKNVNFTYESNKNKILNNFNLEIKKGDFVGLIGESGSGKTTFIDILSGLSKANSGSVLIDGQNIDNNIKSWQSNVGYVSQQTFLLNDSILNNVTLKNYKNKNYKERAIKALKDAGLGKFIEKLEKGLDTILGDDGSKISGGQKQRIGIARAIYHDPEVYIFDEITSSLDKSSERKIIETLLKLKSNKTVILITHNPDNLSICDYVIEIKNEK